LPAAAVTGITFGITGTDNLEFVIVANHVARALVFILEHKWFLFEQLPANIFKTPVLRV